MRPDAAAARAVRTGATAGRLVTAILEERSGVLAIAAVCGVALLLSYLLWLPAGVPARIIDAPIPATDCAGTDAQGRQDPPVGSNEMRVCAARVAALTMIGPIAMTVLVVTLRRPISRYVQSIAPYLPRGASELLAPALATLLFLLSWAGVHWSTGWQTGLLPHKMFPAVIAVSTFSTGRYGPALGRRFPGFYDARDRVPAVLRLVVVIAIPMALSLWITNQDRVSNQALKEQTIALLGLALAFVLLAPRSGDIVAGVRGMRLPGRPGSAPAVARP